VKISRVIILVVVIVVIALVALFAYEIIFAPNTTSNSVWKSGSEYSLQAAGGFDVGGQQCVNSTGYIYCIGGEDVNSAPRNNIYSSNLLSSSSPDLSSWTSDSNVYPQTIFGQSCVNYSAHVYCIGGIYDDAGDDVNSSYYASLSNGEVSSWKYTTSYPASADTLSCVASSGYIYCVGGTAESNGLNATAAGSNSVWFAPLTTSGIGNWSLTSSYPSNVYYPICYASQGYIYCLGGADGNSNAVDSVYYAVLSSTGVGAWTATTPYPTQLSGQSCVIVSSSIYCVGGQGNQGAYSSSVYFATVSLSGVGAWKQVASYSDAAETNCVFSSGYLYCIGGFDGSSSSETPEVNYASLSSLASSSP
jgi:hypothetical protein